MPGRVNKTRFKHIYSTFQSISVQTDQSLMLIDYISQISDGTNIRGHEVLHHYQQHFGDAVKNIICCKINPDCLTPAMVSLFD